MESSKTSRRGRSSCSAFWSGRPAVWTSSLPRVRYHVSNGAYCFSRRPMEWHNYSYPPQRSSPILHRRTVDAPIEHAHSKPLPLHETTSRQKAEESGRPGNENKEERRAKLIENAICCKRLENFTRPRLYSRIVH